MFKLLFPILMAGIFVSSSVTADDREAIKKVVLDYIESQHAPNADRMDQALHGEMKKRTFWNSPEKGEFLLESSRDTMLDVARTYNERGDRFPAKPRKDIEIFDIDGRTASVKLTTDEWIDYMHLMKLESGEWKIVNVLWQYHDQSRQVSKR